MRRPEPEVVKALANINRHNPDVYSWLHDWYRQELEQLPSVGQNVMLAQGRCQVLKEIYELIRDAPDVITTNR